MTSTDYGQLKRATLIPDNIVYKDGIYRYVNHKDKLATTGFTNRPGLEKNTDIIRFDFGTVDRMKARYKDMFENRMSKARDFIKFLEDNTEHVLKGAQIDTAIPDRERDQDDEWKFNSGETPVFHRVKGTIRRVS